MTIELELQLASTIKTIPHPAQFREWVAHAVSSRAESGIMTIRIVDEAESAALNLEYRHKNGPTNVLSFPYEPPIGMEDEMLGDLIICAPVVEKEAAKFDKNLLAHWAHMVVHGTLHLLGYDHELDSEAIEMETLEVEILSELGFSSPYGAQ